MTKALRTCLVACLLLTLLFYGWQNGFADKGGSVSLPKAAWLGLTVFFWLLWPLLVLADGRSSPRLRRAYLWFWLPMLLRALIELYLLAVGGWQYLYGIGHDVFSAVLLLCAAVYCRRQQPAATVHTLWIMALMFVAEAAFAAYIAQFNTSHQHAELWFIDWQPPHLANQLVTSALVLGLIGWLACLSRHWAAPRHSAS